MLTTIVGLYLGLSLMFGLLWFFFKLCILEEALCMPLFMVVWYNTDGLRLIPQLIVTGIVALFELPGEILTLILVGFTYIFIGIFYFIPWLVCRDREQVLKNWREHWMTNPFEFD